MNFIYWRKNLPQIQEKTLEVTVPLGFNGLMWLKPKTYLFVPSAKADGKGLIRKKHSKWQTYYVWV